ncbi:MAG: 2-amino-4-hydroxy-6-hydroxymethyldihydropteridine diphosphokinase [Chitinophagaceae bacterium]
MNQAYLLIGGNLGEKRRNLELAATLIGKKAGSVQKTSPFYETEAWGKTDQPAFLNQALLVETALGPHELLKVLLAIEAECGRVRMEKYGPRLIDIDIIFYNELVLSTPELTIPHPQMAFRRFVLTPLNDIAGTFVHPVLRKPVSSLLAECTDKLDAIRV